MFLAIEVSHSSLNVDRRLKVPMYARARIAEVWIADLTTNAIESYRWREP